MTCFAVKMSNTLDPIPEHTRLKGRDVLQILENCSLDLTQSLAFDCGKPHKGLKSPQPPFGRVPSPRNMSRGPCDLAERAKPIWRLPTINATCADRLRQRCSCPRIFGGKIYRMHLLIDEAIINQINTTSECVLLCRSSWKTKGKHSNAQYVRYVDVAQVLYRMNDFASGAT